MYIFLLNNVSLIHLTNFMRTIFLFFEDNLYLRQIKCE